MELGLLMWLVVGGLIGWIASLLMGTNARQGCLMNVVVGIIGSFIGGYLFHRGTINSGILSVESFAVSVLGAFILLAILILLRGRRI